MKKIILINFVFLIIFFAGYYTHFQLQPSPPTDTFTEKHFQGDYKFINPLLECNDNAVSHDTNLDPLRHQINQFIQSEKLSNHITHTSVYYRDMNNGPWFGLMEKDYFSPASLIKVPLMIGYYKLAETDPTILEKELTLNSNEANKSQNIPPGTTLAPDQKYSVSDLINQMIIHSDNSVYDLLMENFDNKLLVSTYSDLGIDISKGFTDPDGDIITVKAYASFFRILYNASYLSKENSEKALQLLSQSQFNEGLVAGVAKNTKVAHKFGERKYVQKSIDQLHDCGVVYLPGKHYLLCVMTRGRDFSQLQKVIANISSLIYNYVK